MNTIEMYLEDTIVYKKIKRNFGNSNQLMNTTIIALDNFKKNGEMINSLEGTVSWNPKDKLSSVNRAMVMVRKSFFNYIVDMIDAYFHELRKNFHFTVLEKIVSQYDNSNSIRDKANMFSSLFDVDEIYLVFIDLLLSWRNNITHYSSKHDFKKEKSKLAKNCFKNLHSSYSHLDVDLLFDHFNEGEEVKHKELLFFNTIALEYINIIDKKLLASMSINKYISFLIYENTKFINKIGKVKKTRQKNYLIGYLSQFGFTSNLKKKYDISDKRSRYVISKPLIVNLDDVLDKISAMS